MKIYNKVVIDSNGTILEEDSYEYDGPIAEAKGQSGGTQKVEPWAAARPFLRQGLTEAQNLYNQGPDQYYSGSTVSPFTDAQQQGQQQALDYGNTYAPAVSNAISQNSAIASGSLLDPNSNPYLKQVADANAQQIGDQFNRYILPGIRQNAQSAGQYFGGSRQGIAEGLAASEAQKNIANSTSNLYNNAYNQGLAYQQNAIQNTPSLAASGYLPSQVAQQVGGTQQQQNQANLQDQVNRFYFNQQAPYDALNRYFNLASQAGGLGSATQLPNQYTNPAAGALGGAVSGAGVAAKFSKDPISAVIGGLGGGLLGLF